MRRVATAAVVFAVTALTMLVLDVVWLALVARGLYDSALGPLKRSSVFLPAAGLFYVFYDIVIICYAVYGARSLASAALKGATLGLVVYASYELTNWAVLAHWPAFLVPFDVAWGVVLGATAAAAGKLVHMKLSNGAPLG